MIMNGDDQDATEGGANELLWSRNYALDVGIIKANYPELPYEGEWPEDLVKLPRIYRPVGDFKAHPMFVPGDYYSLSQLASIPPEHQWIEHKVGDFHMSMSFAQHYAEQEAADEAWLQGGLKLAADRDRREAQAKKEEGSTEGESEDEWEEESEEESKEESKETMLLRKARKEAKELETPEQRRERRREKRHLNKVAKIGKRLEKEDPLQYDPEIPPDFPPGSPSESPPSSS
jgi:hypothetical protein